MVYQPKRQYEWSTFERCVSANIVGGVVEQLEEKNGKVTSEDFLDASRPEDSATHKLFEWDDAKAAERYRLDQSRHIIIDLRVVYVSPKNDEMKVSAFVNVTDSTAKTVYENIDSALKDDGKREIILNRIRGELNAFIIRNQHIEELADILLEASEKVRQKKGA